MASPQVENGHTKIANEILEQLMKIHLSPNQWQVLICIMRKTYGYHKKVDYIANCQIIESTGLCKAVVSRVLSALEKMNIIVRYGKNIGFQKDWESWNKLAEQSTNVSRIVNLQMLAEQSTLATKLAEQSTDEKLAVSTSKLAEQSTKVSSPRVTQKKKETIQKKYIYSLFLKFWEAYPKKVSKGNAEKAFYSIKPDDILLDTILKAIDAQSKSEQWQSDGGKYIPHPATWLNGKRWEDELPQVKNNGHKPEPVKQYKEIKDIPV